MTALPCNAVVRACRTCGRAHDAESWAALPLLGWQGLRREGETTCLELRNCECGSTLAIEVPMPAREAA